MLYELLFPFAQHVKFFNLLQYITVRAGGAFFTAFFLSILVGPTLIRQFRVWQKGGATVRNDHPGETVSAKAGTPTMGGALIALTLFSSVLLWADLRVPYVWLLLLVFATFGIVGFLDDYLTMTRGRNKGLSGKVRLATETLVCAGVVATVMNLRLLPDATTVYVPFFKSVAWDLGLVGFVLFGILVIVGSSNAVNLTDGLDGLVSVPAVVAAGAFASVAYVVGRADYAGYLHVAHIPGAGEVAVFLSALCGAVLGFLWFNAPPAKIFMGDTGSLPIGAALGAAAVILKQEFMLAIMGGVFVMETLSVMIQVASYKLRGKRVFRMAPIHHHFEHKGWAETTVVIRFWILAILFAVVGLATLKIR